MLAAGGRKAAGPLGVGSGGRTRTGDTAIMSRLLCHLSYTAVIQARREPGWSPLTESNRRPSPYHGDALPTELRGHGLAIQRTRSGKSTRPRSRDEIESPGALPAVLTARR